MAHMLASCVAVVSFTTMITVPAATSTYTLVSALAQHNVRKNVHAPVTNQITLHCCRPDILQHYIKITFWLTHKKQH